MKLNIAGKEINIKYGYKPTLKERIISKAVKFSKLTDANGNLDMEKLEDLMLFLPEMLLVGMQVHHKDYKYNYDTGEGKEKQLEKAFGLVEEYMESEDADVTELFEKLQEALTQDSFLAGLFQKEQNKAETAQVAANNAVQSETN